jgi:hypothetical protein
MYNEKSDSLSMGTPQADRYKLSATLPETTLSE